jgi:hypothetical protein
MDSFENQLSVSEQELEFALRGYAHVPWSDYLLNPRRLRGSDFLMRWSQGVWSEERLLSAVNSTIDFFALPYGPSGVAPDKDPREFELYFERLEAAGVKGLKRPDLLILRKHDQKSALDLVRNLGGPQELPFTTEGVLTELLGSAIMAVECENSLWVASEMPDYRSVLTPQRRKGGALGLRKNAVLPTIILKKEDLMPLLEWQNRHGIPIHIWHVFFDLAFGISLTQAVKLIEDGTVEATEQTFQAPSGATTTKTIYKIYYHYGYPLGESRSSPKLTAAYIKDKNGHILPYVKFEGGELVLLETARNVIREMAAKSK